MEYDVKGNPLNLFSKKGYKMNELDLPRIKIIGRRGRTDEEKTSSSTT